MQDAGSKMRDNGRRVDEELVLPELFKFKWRLKAEGSTHVCIIYLMLTFLPLTPYTRNNT